MRNQLRRWTESHQSWLIALAALLGLLAAWRIHSGDAVGGLAAFSAAIGVGRAVY